MAFLSWKRSELVEQSKGVSGLLRHAGLQPRQRVGPTKPGVAPGPEGDRMPKKSFEQRLKEETPHFGRKRVVPRPKGMSAIDPYANDPALTKIENTIVGRARWPKTRYRKLKPRT